MARHKFYQSTIWYKTRKKFLAFSKIKSCYRCWKKDKRLVINTIYKGIKRGIVVHHINPLSAQDMDQLNAKCFDFKNMELLCWPCHEKHHNRGQKEPLPEGWVFNQEGNIVKKV